MRSLTPKPVLLVLATLLIVSAIALIEFQFGRVALDDTRARVDPPPAEQVSEPTTKLARTAEGQSTAERIASKEAEFPRAKEIIGLTGFINTEGVSIGENLGEKVVLLEFWTYSWRKCQQGN